MFRPDYRIFLSLAALCAIPILLPIKSGIRIPVKCKDGVMGYIDDSGNMTLPPRWHHASPFNESGVAYVSNQSLDVWTITRSGKKERPTGPFVSYSSIHPDYMPLGPDSHGMILLRTPGATRWTLADQTTPAFPGVWDAGHPFQGEHPAAVLKEGRWGFINRKGETVIPFEWDHALSFDKQGLACVCRNGQWGAIDTSGKIVVPLYFSKMTGFDDEGMCGASTNSGSGFINREGHIVIPFRYVEISPFDVGGLARVVQAENWHSNGRRVGWINRSGQTIIPFEQDNTFTSWGLSFKNHPRVLPVQLGARSGLRDRKGRWVVPLGVGELQLVKDPIAPDREWFVRHPDYETLRHDPSNPPFQSACYDENGRQIWSGWRFTRWESFLLISIAFGVIALGDLILKRMRAKHCIT